MKPFRINITRRVDIEGKGFRFCNVVIGTNHKIKPDAVTFNGQEIHPTAGLYYLDFLDKGKRVRRAAGATAAEAQLAADLQEKQLAAKFHAAAAGIVLPEAPTAGRSLAEAIDTYLLEVSAKTKAKTQGSYKVALAYFLKSCSKTTVEQIDRTDMLKFTTFLRTVRVGHGEKTLSPRTVANKFESVTFFLRWADAPLVHAKDNRKVAKGDRPKFVKKDVKVYERAETDALFEACDADERLLFEFFLMTGMREQEVQHSSWEDINFAHGTITVRYKPEYGFDPKAFKEREIPVPDSLIKNLKARKTKADKTCGLIFPNGKCTPNKYFLKTLKAIATRAKLNPKNFILHRFRATFCTWHLWANVDLRTVQSWAGHTTIESTMRYLKPNQNEAVRDKVNATFA